MVGRVVPALLHAGRRGSSLAPLDHVQEPPQAKADQHHQAHGVQEQDQPELLNRGWSPAVGVVSLGQNPETPSLRQR